MITRYATRVNGITDYFLTKLDVLSSLETVPVCVGYTRRRQGDINEMPMTQSDICTAPNPSTRNFPVGGRTSARSPRPSTNCPPRRATTCCGWKSLLAPMFRASGSGPGREQTIVRRDVLAARPVTDPEDSDQNNSTPITSITAVSRNTARPARGRASAGSSRPCGGYRTWRCPPTPATICGTTPPSTPKRWPVSLRRTRRPKDRPQRADRRNCREWAACCYRRGR